MALSSEQQHFLNHFDHLRGQTISNVLPYCGLILTTICVIIFAVRFYIFEPFARKYYKELYTGLDEVQRRSFINHHVAGTCKLLLVALAAYPFVAVISGAKKFRDPMSPGSPVHMGDMLLIISQLFTAMYIFELFYRTSVSYISAAHHIGAIIIAQSATVLSLSPDHKSDAVIEFILCLLWGFFDVVAEFWPHLAIIVYRLCPHDHHKLAKVFFLSMCLELIGTVVETITVLTIFFSLWQNWTLGFKIVTPILHLLFSLAQLWGARVFWQMHLQQKKLACQERADVEQVLGAESSSSMQSLHVEAEREKMV